MKEITDHLHAALRLLNKRRDDAKARYDKHEKYFAKSRRHVSVAMREAWYTYRATDDMIHLINDALVAAMEVPSKK